MNGTPILINGIHLTLTDALKQTVQSKMEKLVQHAPDLLRIRIELVKETHRPDKFLAKGYLEIQGPDIMVATDSDDLYAAIDDLQEKLLRKLRNRTRALEQKRKRVNPQTSDCGIC